MNHTNLCISLATPTPPKANRSLTNVVSYLKGRGIDMELIVFCIKTGRVYESECHHYAVFVGMDQAGKPKYAALRGIGTDFIGEASGSDKNYSFSVPVPAALTRFLEEYPEVENIVFHLDNDRAGRLATLAIRSVLPERYHTEDKPPSGGNDFNDALCIQLGIRQTKRTKKSERSHER